jgi:hypothetical protein
MSETTVAEIVTVGTTIVEAIRAIVDWLADDAAGAMPPSASIAALVAMIDADHEARADLIAQAKATPELRAQIAALSDAYESLYPSLLALTVEIEA